MKKEKNHVRVAERNQSQLQIHQLSGIQSRRNLVKLSNHLRQVHKLSDIERKYWSQFAKLQNTNMVCVYENEVEPRTMFL